MVEILVLSDREVEGLLSVRRLMSVMEEAFAEYASGGSTIYPVVREEIAEHDAIFGIKSGFARTREALGLKAGGFWAQNVEHGLTAHQSTVLLFHPEYGTPSCMVSGNYITFVRTSAAGAIATRHLARADSRIVGLIGTGVQGRAQLMGMRAVRPIERVLAYDIRSEAAEQFAEEMETNGILVEPVSKAEAAVTGSDIVVTTTPSTSAIVHDQWVRPGTHINAIGADTRGKQELEPALFKRARVIVDDLVQAREIGESQHALRMGIIDIDDIYATLGELAAGMKIGRASPDEVTIFDATGLAFQDLVAAKLAYQLAQERGVGSRVEI